MTNREAIKLIERARFGEFPYSVLTIEAFDLAISALKKQEQGRWNPVSKDLPKKNGDYLVTCEVCGERYIEESFFCRCDDGGVFWTSQNVIAWQPRIEPYTAEEENHEM